MVATLCLLAVIVVAVIAVSIEDRRDRRPRAARKRGTGRRSPRRTHPLDVFTAEQRDQRRDRRSECQRIRRVTDAATHQGDATEGGHFAGHVVLVHDVWRGADFTLRNRAVGMGWLPFVDVPEHHETAAAATARLDRAYRLNGEEKETLELIDEDDAGQIALAIGQIAARIHRYPAWRLPFFDENGVRVDLTAEVTEVTTAAKRLRAQREILGPAPFGALRADDLIVSTYIAKARTLDTRVDGLMDRLRALAEYRTVVARIQERHDKQEWMARVDAIDDFDHAVESELDRHHGDDIRGAANESELLASVYLDTLTPLTATLTTTDAPQRD
ncbi:MULTISPECIES: hypothetical protein [unclassified Gordonia (in: high G+C Gram-positive bacteria)]|uniref:hypothetical protein n=1 Tax=unclassified Gordonia (in: high G+C Gram-positive bacteria) TaxID=2657482 RepID=UPI00209AE57B|nr:MULTISPECIES: hypothetical protein [unclassified Gordonia (in: high G+C Gram-positive bacteria)]MDF3281605.1 hypothetical protein [Gordonia sp. N1V]